MSPPLRLPRSQLVLAATRALCAFLVFAALPACKPARRFYRRHVAQAPAVSPARAQRVQHGREAYLRYCALCHANDGRGYRADHANAVANPDFLSVASDDFGGWLGTYFGVPYVFGSNGAEGSTHQTDRYTGADCADVLVGARRAAGSRALAYTSGA